MRRMRDPPKSLKRAGGRQLTEAKTTGEKLRTYSLRMRQRLVSEDHVCYLAALEHAPFAPEGGPAYLGGWT